MLLYPDDLPSADIDADGFCCHFIHSSMGLGLGIADKSLGRNGLNFHMLMYPDDLPSVYRRL